MFSFRGTASFDGSAFEAGLNRLSQAASVGAKKIGSYFKDGVIAKVGSAFAFGALSAGFVRIIDQSIELVSNLKDIAEQNDITVREAQKLQKLAENSGLAFDDYARALSAFGDARRKAFSGDQDARRELAEYGITLKEIQDPLIRNITLFEKMGKSMASLTANQRSSIKELFGRNGDKIANSVSQYSAIQVNSPITDEEVQIVDTLKKQKSEMWEGLKKNLLRIFITGPIRAQNQYDDALAAQAEAFGQAISSNPKPKPALSSKEDYEDFMAQFEGAKTAKQIQESTINGSSDPLFFKEESAHAKEMNALYQKGLEIQFERMGTLGRIREMNREIAALEIQKAEADSGTSDDKQESNEISREIAKKKMELENFRRGVNVGGAQYDLSERQRIGAFAGNMNSLLNINERQVQVLETMLGVMRNPPKGRGPSLRVR